ncbi:DUF1045 domain-containing protein [Cupriavidus taiwanensis]|uniref:Uncharacterized protein n=1 Tax=Cupriavidus taiwanensis TaxID=164546 RepID=A0A375HIP0_9BURK|nr:DUF1045 domain-containing protein [Cupriavidus taiwanensis]SOY61607.1 conserved hypothetical protein; DUF1045 [Cupriavidus taiwanensis]SOY62666.1 conserved hypothetical protein; DUF1045 [Cupriavidus taiwanensis]SOY98103.1 conserved hypothetical protein; DUF1045 [Cupriavidus taiwanensis]SOZ31817.1 conserved hypothetical protein; DUF1045 [Cupriavidus taiwanensis]SOZ68470.1 conserved hypothetical protein; DUF1045 [Cupriavidus taiwanensis]
MTQDAYRYAIYLSPSGPLHSFGSQWLGRDADTGATLPPPPGMPAAPAEWLRAPAHYGLHATLKPPFRLADGANGAMVDAIARDLARRQAPFDAALALRALRGFVAWGLADGGSPPMQALADACVQAFDPLRAPPSAQELARRAPDQLSAEERRMAEAWGYPYVFGTFVFHITLTGMLDVAGQRAAIAQLEAASGKLLQAPLHVDRISVFVQPAHGEDFVVARHYGFDGSTVDRAGAAYLGT